MSGTKLLHARRRSLRLSLTPDGTFEHLSARRQARFGCLPPPGPSVNPSAVVHGESARSWSDFSSPAGLHLFDVGFRKIRRLISRRGFAQPSRPDQLHNCWTAKPKANRATT